MNEPGVKRGHRGTILTLLLGMAFVVGAGYGAYALRKDKDTQLASARVDLAAGVARGPRVQVATVDAGPKERLIRLLGDTRGYQTAVLYSKVGGYLTTIAVDRGDMVKTGQVLAEIDSAETDSQLASALSDLENKRKNAKRARELVASGARSIQAIEQAETDSRMADARVNELTAMKSYEMIRAPFDGRVTARFIDPGGLVQNATTNQTSNQPILTLVDDSRLRVNVYVEQRDVPNVHVGDVADVSDAADSARTVQARIARTSGQLDPRTRTLFVELEVDNTDKFLVPGSFAYVTLHVPLESVPQIPVAGLVVRGTRTFVAGVGSDDLVHLRPVTVSTTDGIRASVTEGVKVGDRVALNLPDEVGDGSRVQPMAAPR